MKPFPQLPSVLCLRAPVGEAEDTAVDVPAEPAVSAPVEKLGAADGTRAPDIVTATNPLKAADGVK